MDISVFGLGYVGGPTQPEYDSGLEFPQVSGHLRAGALDKAYVSLRLMEGVPFYSGGGVFDAGIGFRVARPWDAWLGLSLPVPYDKLGIAAKSSLHVLPSVSLDLAGRYGKSEGIAEYGASVGVTFSLIHSRTVGPD